MGDLSLAINISDLITGVIYRVTILACKRSDFVD